MKTGIRKTSATSRINKRVLMRAFLVLLLISLCAGFQPALAQEETPPDWRRIRTNSVPYMPDDLTVDSTGAVWVTAATDSEYDPGVWRLPPGETRFQYLTNSRANNWLKDGYNNVVETPNLTEDVNYAAQDDAGNVWYAFNNRTVLVEKAAGGWQTIAMEDTGGENYIGVDSAHKIRFIDNQDGSQDALLISGTNTKRIAPNFNETESRSEYISGNSSYVKDLFIDSHGRYWAANGYGVQFGSTIYTNKWYPAYSEEYKDDPEAPPYNPTVITSTIEGIYDIAEDSLGNMWFAAGAGVYCLTSPDGGNDWVKYDLRAMASLTFNAGTDDENKCSNIVNCMEAGANGTMWFGPRYSGIVKYTPGSGWTRTTCESLGIPSEEILSMKEHDSKLWFTSYSNTVNSGVYAVNFSDSSVTAWKYRESSTTLTSNRINSVAADLSGGVWFASYDLPKVARLKADGTWVQYHLEAMEYPYPGQGSVVGVGVDSHNIVFIAPDNRAPLAYDVNSEAWLDLPAGLAANTKFYSLYIDPKNGKWFLGGDFVYYLNDDNTAWTTYDTTDESTFSSENVTDALMDAEENMWFSTFWGLCVAKNDPISGTVWIQFDHGDETGFMGGYSERVFLDGDGVIWNSVYQTYDSAANTWTTQTDATPYLTRPLVFLNGNLPADMELTGAPEELTGTNQVLMTVDTEGNVYFAGGMFWLGSINKGVIVCSPIKGDVSRDGRIDLKDAVFSMGAMAGKTTGIQSIPTDVTGDGKVDQAETIYVLQKIAELR